MPCNSDYLKPTTREAELQRAARLYFYVLTNTGGVLPEQVIADANDIYCKTDYVPELCAAINRMDVATLSRVVYDARNKSSRDLADWWESHSRADAERQAKDAKQENLTKQQRIEKAGPALLEALLRLRAAYQTSNSSDVRLSCWDQASAAIAKATGNP